MKRVTRFITRRPRTLPGGRILLLVSFSLIAGVFPLVSSCVGGWGFSGLALIATLGALVIITGRGGGRRPTDRKEGRMDPRRVEALVSLFKGLENRRRPGRMKEPGQPVAQSEEEYRKEQAEWLAAVKRKKERKKGGPPASDG